MSAVRRRLLRRFLQISPLPPAGEGRNGCRLTPFSPQPPSNLSLPASERGVKWVPFDAAFSETPSNLPSPAGGRGVGGEGNRRQKQIAVSLRKCVVRAKSYVLSAVCIRRKALRVCALRLWHEQDPKPSDRAKSAPDMTFDKRLKSRTAHPTSG